MIDTIVLQSQRLPLPHAWLQPCLNSVRVWAQHHGYDYRFIDDALFEVLPADLERKLSSRRVIASDLARLLQLRRLLQQDYDRAIWCDADVLIIDPTTFVLIDESYALGRELWVDSDERGRLKSWSKVHNAFLMFRRENSFLEFYNDTAQKLLRATDIDAIPAQFIGPKLLTALHNIARCPVQKTAGMLSPRVIEDLLNGGGQALKLFLDESGTLPTAINLCTSSVTGGRLTDRQLQELIPKLLCNRDDPWQRG